jgi:hypothetical protein
MERVGQTAGRMAAYFSGHVLPALVKLGGFLAETFGPTLRAFGDYLQTRLIPAWQGLSARIKDNIGPILKVAGAILYVAAKVAGVVLPILIRLSGVFAKTLFAAIGVAIGILGGVARALIAIASTAATVGSKIATFVTNVVSFITGMPDKIKRAASGMFDGIKDAFRSALNWVIDKWNALEFRLPAVDTHIPGVGKIGGFTLGVPDIPRLATGALVKSRPGVGILANIGEGREDEAVLPVSRLESMLDRAAASGAPAQRVDSKQLQPVQLVVDGRVLAETVFEIGGRDYAAGRKDDFL